jgi:hypothetical protein
MDNRLDDPPPLSVDPHEILKDLVRRLAREHIASREGRLQPIGGLQIHGNEPGCMREELPIHIRIHATTELFST